MKVVHLITRLILGGAQENTLLSVRGQQHDWHDEVTLITGPGLGPEGSLIQRARDDDLDIRIIPALRRNIHPLRDWQSYREIVRLLRDIGPDVVHTHSSKAGIMGRAAATKLGIPVVHTIHGPAFHEYQSRVAYHVFLAAEKWAARRCQLLISVCDAMTDRYVAAGVAKRSQFRTVYSGMDVGPFLDPPRSANEVRAELGIAPGHVVVGKVARLFHLKGHDDLIAAAETVVARCPHVRFLLVGDGVLRERFQSQIASAGLTEHFIFTGLVPPERVPELIAAMDVVVHTSLREGLARVLPQALIAGKPVISYDVDGAREVCITDETGILLPPRSVSELADAILCLVTDEDLRKRLGEHGREKFTEQFRHQNMVRQLRDIYASLLEG